MSVKFELNPSNLMKVLEEQIGMFQYTEKKKPNCVIFGVEIIRILNNGTRFDETKDGVFLDGMKVFIDPDHNAAINVAYSPFVVGGNQIIVARDQTKNPQSGSPHYKRSSKLLPKKY